MRGTRTYTREFKLSVLQEIETGPIVEVCRAHNLAPSTVSGWIKAYKKTLKTHLKAKAMHTRKKLRLLNMKE